MSRLIQDQIHEIIDRLTPDQLLTVRLFLEDLQSGQTGRRTRLSAADPEERREQLQRSPSPARKLRDSLYRRALGLDE
ncbi:MAG: hypothetical protein GC160_21465 [Acidobacteria bacterium]|nr:hypothetical protein [Acidobacteriota bacterium]